MPVVKLTDVTVTVSVMVQRKSPRYFGNVEFKITQITSWELAERRGSSDVGVR